MCFYGRGWRGLTSGLLAHVRFSLGPSQDAPRCPTATAWSTVLMVGVAEGCEGPAESISNLESRSPGICLRLMLVGHVLHLGDLGVASVCVAVAVSSGL